MAYTAFATYVQMSLPRLNSFGCFVGRTLISSYDDLIVQRRFAQIQTIVKTFCSSIFYEHDSARSFETEPLIAEI